MKKICLLVLVAFTVIGISAQAQDVSIGFKGGMTIPSIRPGGTKTPLSEGYSSRLAWGAGAFAELQFTKTFSLTVGLEYSGQGGKKNGMQALPAGQVTGPAISGIKQALESALVAQGVPQGVIQGILPAADNLLPADGYIYADFKSTAKFHYMMLPVQAKFGWNFSPTSPFRAYVSAGVFASYLVKAERVSRGTSSLYADNAGTSIGNYATAAVGAMPEPAQSIYSNFLQAGGQSQLNAERNFDQTQNITDDIHRFNFGFIANVGISYDINPRHRVFVEGGGNYGLIKIQKSDVNGQNRIGSGIVMLGYSYKL